jgi:hypothetical protein
MILFWRGWGIHVFFLFCFWMLAAIALAVASGTYEPDPLKAALDVQWGMAGMFLAYALSVYALARYRKSHPQMVTDPHTGNTVPVPHVDDLYGIRLDIWPYILGTITLLIAGLTASGYVIFKD